MRRALALSALLLAALGASCRSASSRGEARTLEGTVTYLVRMALPEDAVVTVRVADVTLRGIAPFVIAEKRIEKPGQVPIPFELEIAADRFDPAHDYVFSADIRSGDRRLFATPSPIPVLTKGKAGSIVAVLQPAS